MERRKHEALRHRDVEIDNIEKFLLVGVIQTVVVK